MHSKRRSMKNKKAISPVIATVILVAVAVAIAIAVAFWAAGLAGTFTRFEKLEVGSAYAITNTSAGFTWDVKILAVNTGSSDATITNIFINGVPYTDASLTSVVAVTPTPSIPMVVGSNCTIIVQILESTGFIHGQTIDVKLHTASGTDYPKSIVLP